MTTEATTLTGPDVAGLDLPPGRVDSLLAATARRRPRQVAVHGKTGSVDYAELDERATLTALALRRLDLAPDSVVAVSALLDPVFPAVYHGVARGGFVIASVNPLLPPEAIGYILKLSSARVALVSAPVYERLQAVRDQLPDLTSVFLIGPCPPELAGVVPSWEAQLDEVRAALARGDVDAAQLTPAQEVDEDDVAALVFTSGTTGRPKGVQLTHRNLKTNAAQMARAHHVGEDAVVMAYLPVYHPMHMNMTVLNGATQVLCGSHDILDGVAAANRFGVTHFYTLPLVLGWFEQHPKLAQMHFEKVRLIASGASYLSPHLVSVLTEQFHVPVFQGYGMCEASQLTTSDGPVAPRPGSVGHPLAGCELRVVDLTGRQPVEPGVLGEVQVRGPHLMRGYLNRPDLRPFDADGWYSTGDSGYLDDDGYLFLLDRVVDLFTCDGELVAPARIERVVSALPGVRDCAVVDLPDPQSGAVAAAAVVLTSPDGAVPAAIAEAVAPDLAAHERIALVEFVPEIPRSPTNGKVLRAQLREQLAARVEDPR